MFKITWFGIAIGSVKYDTEDDAWRTVHEALEEAFGENYGEIELSEYAVIPM